MLKRMLYMNIKIVVPCFVNTIKIEERNINEKKFSKILFIKKSYYYYYYLFNFWEKKITLY